MSPSPAAKENEVMGSDKSQHRTSRARWGPLLLSMAMVGLAACGGAASSASEPSRSAGASTLDTIRLSIAATGGTFDVQAPHLIDSISRLSSGRLRIEHADGWDITGSDQEAEQKIIQAVAAGNLDLGLVGTRSLSALGVTDFEALIAPMLIDNYVLQRAVLDSDIPARMLPSLDELGVTGLAVIGNALRFPSGVDAPFVGPDTYAGTTFHVFSSQVGTATIAALGATATDAAPDDRDVGLANRSINGFENSMAFLAGKPAEARHVTINVPFWPSIGVLVASPAVLDTLNEEQIGWLTDAVADTEAQALDLLGDDQDSVQSVCDQGGAVYQASASDLEALRAAVQPVYDQLASETTTSGYVDEIRELKQTIQGQPLIIPDGCGEGAARSDERLPDGSYRTGLLTIDDLVAALRARGIDQATVDTIVSTMPEAPWTITYRFQAGSFVQLQDVDGREDVGSSGTYRVVDESRLEVKEPCCGKSVIRFTLDGDTLTLRVDIPDEDVQAFCRADPMECAAFLSVIEAGSFTRLGETP
jgi:TRAP-type C4-dicarboxylate transport system substrate-binding protein